MWERKRVLIRDIHNHRIKRHRNISKNLEEIRFRVKKGEKQKYKNAAQKVGMSMATFFITAADEKIERDNKE